MLRKLYYVRRHTANFEIFNHEFLEAITCFDPVTRRNRVLLNTWTGVQGWAKCATYNCCLRHTFKHYTWLFCQIKCYTDCFIQGNCHSLFKTFYYRFSTIVINLSLWLITYHILSGHAVNFLHIRRQPFIVSLRLLENYNVSDVPMAFLEATNTLCLA